VELSARELAEALGGAVVSGAADARASAWSIDSRLAAPGTGFFAIRGARDGHDFVPDAFARGASIAVVADEVPAIGGHATLVRVPESAAALIDAGRFARTRLAHATVVGITGSAGKTATKDLTAAALAGSRQVHASPASYNNEAGLPLTLLGAPETADIVVTEMGARFAGNIADLAEVARPTVGVVTHVGMAHSGPLGGRKGIARVKGELLESLPGEGLAVLNTACDATPGLAARTAAPVLFVGRDPGAEIRISDVELDDELRPRFVLETSWGSAPVILGLRGEQQVENAAMAAGVALWLGAPFETVVAGLRDARGTSLRMELVRTADGVTIINDAYNSSPTSAAAAVRSLAHLRVGGRRVAVLGEMLELGSDTAAEHEAIGALAGAAGIDLLVAVGEPASALAAGARGTALVVRVVPDAAAATALLVEQVRPGDAVLVKASRAVGLERVADELVKGHES
jgi:UDP-N-acetylmuramoyl-tripeptide--D-alanyl-D-alanine ligase